jgi:DNA-directed RNA polymerase subunit beta
MDPNPLFRKGRSAGARRQLFLDVKRKVTYVMAQTFLGQKRLRKYYGKIREVLEMPNLIEVQKASYDLFLKSGDQLDPTDGEGIMGVFQSVFPIKDFNETSILEFVKYELEKPKYDVEECQQRDMTYSAPLKVTLRLIVFDVDEDTGAKSVKDIKEQDVFMGDMPLMTPNGTFIVNGTERVIVSQMHRSPGVFFDHDKGKTHSSGKLLFACRIIPYRGSWLDFEFDAKDIVFARIDRRRKLPVTTLLYALGLDQEGIMDAYYNTVDYTLQRGQGWVTKFFPERVRGTRPTYDLVDADSGEVIAEAGKKVTPRAVKKLIDEGNVKNLLVPFDRILGKFVAKDIINEETGAIYVEAGDELTLEYDKDGEIIGGSLQDLLEAGITEIPVLDIDNVNVGPYMRNTMATDKNMDRNSALMDIYRVMRPGEPPTVEAASALFDTLFFDSERYDLSAVGRVKMNMRLALDAEDTVRTLRKEDIVACIKALVELRDGKGDIDDIDHLGNRRVRSVGELMENQYRVGLLRMERAIKERMSSVEIDTVMPQDLINAKPAAAAVREFFGSSQLSQFMDQTNPLSEVTHKRRLSALGPGGLTRERAGFEVRDVHPTHYGRMCPIETPEGPNIGLINSLATFARVNKYGFIETPYRRVENGQVTDEVKYMSATEEMRHTVAQANANLDENGRFVNELVNTRQSGEYTLAPNESVDLIDVSPKQLVSVAASLIPFLENDDANRALMGSNMQRQAVPLLRAEAPLVGTGIEEVVARDSGAAIMAKRAGVIDQVDAQRIVVRATEDLELGDAGVDIYRLRKFQRSNQNTTINQKPLVKVGDTVTKGEVIADGPSTDMGELALGKNVIVAFMPWNGYNYEDSILISERIAKDDVFTSVHIEEFEVAARDTKLGPEEITRDIPNVGEEALRNLDEAGIVYIGADVEPGDILVGKITPKGESPMTPEEKLLRAIFGEKASDVRDTSLRVKPGDYGTVVEVRVFNRHGVEKDERALQIEREEIQRLGRDRDDELTILDRNIYARLRDLILGKTAVKGPKGVKANSEITEDLLASLPRSHWWQLALAEDQDAQIVEALNEQYEIQKRALDARFEDKVEKVRRGDDLPPGVMKMVKVFIAVKRKLQPGDKMAGRHGNKGVISRVVPMEDMPFLADGTPVDFCLNPLGVPSRMNVGQILETHMGWAARGLGIQVDEALGEYRRSGDMTPVKDALKIVYGEDVYEEGFANMDDDQMLEAAGNVTRGVPIATPVFDGAKEADVNDALKRAGFNESGQSILFDGRTGEQFARPVTVGVKYLLKLHHLVDDKIHARSTGPYSLVTQQPLGGKAQFGGQRFGEMEVWALEAYGAAYTLQEMLTVKSDDVAGRTKVYESIVKGEDNFEAGVPESFNVLVKEVRGLGLNMELLDAEGED